MGEDQKKIEVSFNSFETLKHLALQSLHLQHLEGPLSKPPSFSLYSPSGPSDHLCLRKEPFYKKIQVRMEIPLVSSLFSRQKKENVGTRE